MDDSRKGFIHLADWVKQPFSVQMDAINWVLFLGFVIIVSFFWTRVLKHITTGV